jgi:hypothetical protein
MLRVALLSAQAHLAPKAVYSRAEGESCCCGAGRGRGRSRAGTWTEQGGDVDGAGRGRGRSRAGTWTEQGGDVDAGMNGGNTHRHARARARSRIARAAARPPLKPCGRRSSRADRVRPAGPRRRLAESAAGHWQPLVESDAERDRIGRRAQEPLAVPAGDGADGRLKPDGTRRRNGTTGKAACVCVRACHSPCVRARARACRARSRQHDILKHQTRAQGKGGRVCAAIAAAAPA